MGESSEWCKWRVQPVAPSGLSGLLTGELGLGLGSFTAAAQADLQRAFARTITTSLSPPPPSEDDDPRLWLRRRVAEVCFRV